MGKTPTYLVTRGVGRDASCVRVKERPTGKKFTALNGWVSPARMGGGAAGVAGLGARRPADGWVPTRDNASATSHGRVTPGICASASPPRLGVLSSAIRPRNARTSLSGRACRVIDHLRPTHRPREPRREAGAGQRRRGGSQNTHTLHLMHTP